MRHHPIAALKTFVLLLAIALTLSSAHALADTYPRQPGVDAEHYVFRLTLLTTDSNEIEGEATVRLRIAANGVKDALLDLTSATPDGKGMTVTRVTSNGQPVSFTHEHDRLRLPLPASAKAGDDVTFEIAYHGAPADGLRILNTIHGERAAFSDNWFHSARQWLPTIDHIADKATARIHRHDEGRVSGDRQRPADGPGRSAGIHCAAHTGRRTWRSRRGSIRSASRISSCTTKRR